MTTTKRLLVIGGVAAGMSAASQARRRAPDWEVIALERGPHVSYGACGMPYNIMDPGRDPSDLVVVTADTFRTKRGIDVRTRCDALAIDTGQHKVTVRDQQRAAEYDLEYDKLVIATGARAVALPLEGAEAEGIFVLRTLEHCQKLKAFLAEAAPKHVAVVGGGYIGMEMVEAFTTLGLQVTVLEKLPDIMPGYEGEVVDAVRRELEQHQVIVHTGADVEGFSHTHGQVTGVRTSSGNVDADLVLVAVGVRPNSEIASEAGIEIGSASAIEVDRYQGTSATDVYAAGDCAAAYHRVLQRNAWVPLGTTANKQGRIAGANAVGARSQFGGIVGTAVFKVLDLQVARTGLSHGDATQLGRSAVKQVVTAASRAHSYPGGKPITLVLVAERGTGRLLGAQMVGEEGVSKRIDIVATALHANMTVEDLSSLDLAYAPPFAPVWDPVLVAANVIAKKL